MFGRLNLAGIESFCQENPNDPAVVAHQRWQSLPDGRQYKGNFVDGYAIIKYTNGHRYEGYFEASKFHGQGKLTYMGHIAYAGEWIAGEHNIM